MTEVTDITDISGHYFDSSSELDLRRFDALEDGRAREYFWLCNELGVEPEDEFLFERGEADVLVGRNGGLEHVLLDSRNNAKALDAAVRRVAAMPDNISSKVQDCRAQYDGEENPWGIRKAHLERLDQRSLGTLLFGMHNIKIPAEMLVVMNPSEVIAKYFGAGLIKSNDSFPQYDDFRDVFRSLDNAGYQFGVAHKVTRNVRKPFEAKPGEQIKRLGLLSDKARTALVLSYNDRNVDHDFYRPESPSKKILAREVYYQLKNRFDRAMQKTQIQ